MLQAVVGNLFFCLEYAVFAGDRLLIMSGFGDSEMALKGACAKIGLSGEPVRILSDGAILANSPRNLDMEHYHTKIHAGRTEVFQSVSISTEVNREYLFIREETWKEDVYAYLMNEFTFPILREWIDYLWEQLQEKKLMEEIPMTIYGDTDLFQGMKIVRSLLCDETLQELLEKGLQEKWIWITKVKQNPLKFENMDDYFSKYGHTLVSNLENLLEPLTPIREIVDELAFLKKTPYPQQAAIINGAVACLKQKNYAFLIESMGAGKTLQGMGVAEAYFNQKYLNSHPNMTIKDVYMDGSLVKYRVIVMCPPHLVQKWADSIRKDIPYAKAIIVDKLSQLTALREEGRKPTGKEFYIISKDTGKLSYSYRPVPYQVKKKPIKLDVCEKCGREFPLNKAEGCECGSFDWREVELDVCEGLICPECGEILLPVDGRSIWNSKEGRYRTLMPVDFAWQNSANLFCRHCQAALWTPACKPVDNRILFRPPKVKKSKWRQISHFSNRALKARKTVWVHRDYEKDYLRENGIMEDEIKEMDFYGPRRFGLTRYIKKYLKGYFGLAIFDEVHEYKAGGSAQGLAMHDLVKACPKHLALTGTIAGGYASDLFYTLYRLEPRRMKSKGYVYGPAGEKKFVEKYGTVETAYELEENAAYHKMSRGRVLVPQRCRPGISVLIFTEFLLDSALFLDLSDLSRFLPPLYEYVEIVPLENEISSEYGYVRRALREAMKDGEKALMGSFLQFSLSYPDKPYHCPPILSPESGNLIVEAADLSFLTEDKLLKKEEKLIEIVNNEQREERNVFIYCEYTGDENSITYRLKEVLEKHCNLSDYEVVVLESSHPSAAKREEWMHQKAAEGSKVFLTNPKCVATGLDFAFEHHGKFYNYPTIVFYQTGVDMLKIWQASRRHYRLNQPIECRTYFLCSSGTIQLDMVQLIATKEVATSAIQGQFSSEGLAAMASGVDARVVLASAVAEKSEQKEKGLRQMMDVINQRNNQQTEEVSYVRMKTFFELTGYDTVPYIGDPIEAFSDVDIFDLLGYGVSETIEIETEVKEEFFVEVEEDDTEEVIEEKEVLNEETRNTSSDMDETLRFLFMLDD